MEYNLIIPNGDGTSGTKTITTENNIVLVGGNGAGKTRLGVQIENLIQDKVTVLRISAQKALNIPDYAKIESLEQAEKGLLYGNSEKLGTLKFKKNFRWGENPATFLLNDYDKLLSVLFAKSAERDRKYTSEAKVNQEYKNVPKAPIDLIIELWNSIMPHRKISFLDGKVMAKQTDQKEYHGQEMSDGERVILYLIGQCLCMPEHSVIIIDEPEIHLHKSLMDKLWNSIESQIPNKLLIYITHDLEFASTRTDATKIWVKEYNGNNKWVWEEIPTDEELPESLMLEIIGNRKDIIFCEGEKGKLDSTIYQLVYPNFHIIPRGGCEKVIEATKAFRANKSLHHLNAFGIIDSDYKSQEEITSLLSQNIHTISVAEIENLFCIEPIIRIVSAQLELNPNSTVKKVIDYLIKALNDEFEVQVSSKTEKIIEYQLGAFSKESNTEQGIIDGLETTKNRINIHNTYKTAKDLFQSAIDSRDLKQLLLIYNRKSLLDRISNIFGLKSGEYSKLIVRLLKGNRQDEIILALKEYLPNL